MNDEGARAFVDALEKNFSLCELTLDNQIDEEIRKIIEKRIERNKKLAAMPLHERVIMQQLMKEQALEHSKTLTLAFNMGKNKAPEEVQSISLRPVSSF